MLAGSTPGLATDRQGRLHQFRGPVNQQSAEFVEWCILTTKHLVSRCSDGCSSQKSQTCTCDAKEPRGDWRHEPRDLDCKEGPRSTTPVTTCRRRPEALGNKASPREWCPQGCGASASHGRASTRTQNNSVPSRRSKWRGEALRTEHECPHTVWRRKKLRGDSK